MRRGLLVQIYLVPLGLLALSGCLIPYAYPKLDYIPCGDLHLESPDCHVFRVDAETYQVDIGETSKYTIAEIERRPDGTFPSQLSFEIDRGYYVVSMAVNHNVGFMHATRVRIYRPGYPLVETASGNAEAAYSAENKPVDWHAQERAINDLIRCPAITDEEMDRRQHDERIRRRTRGLPRGIDILTSQPAFLFAAGEYERVALLADNPADAERLRNKAREIRNVIESANSTLWATPTQTSTQTTITIPMPTPTPLPAPTPLPKPTAQPAPTPLPEPAAIPAEAPTLAPIPMPTTTPTPTPVPVSPPPALPLQTLTPLQTPPPIQILP